MKRLEYIDHPKLYRPEDTIRASPGVGRKCVNVGRRLATATGENLSRSSQQHVMGPMSIVL